MKEFIHHYERLCAQNNVTNDAEKCEMVLRYCSKREKQTIKNISGYAEKSWGRLRENILRLYDADLDTRRYKVKDVRNFANKQKEKKIRDLAGWKKYCRAFIRIAGSLLSEGKLSETEYATYFWQGIARTLRIRVENRILAKDPIRDLSDPFTVEEVDTAAAAILQRDRFDCAFEDTDSEGDSSYGESSSESDDESSESESEDEKEKRKRRAKKKKSRTRMHKKETRRPFPDSDDESPFRKKRTISEPRQEVEGLIKQMNLLARDEPDYGIAYYRALKLDPDITKIVAEPSLRRGEQRYLVRSAATYQQTSAPQSLVPQNSQPAPYHPAPPPAQSIQYPQPAQPIQYPPPAQPIQYPPPVQYPQYHPPTMAPPRGSEMTCYGCGEKGHGMNRCSTIGELVDKGLLVKDIAGRIIYPDGSAIRRMPNETYAQAFEREQAPKTHLITIADNQGYSSDSEDDWKPTEQSENSDWLDDTDREDVFAVQDVHWDSYGVDRPEKSIAAKKRTVMEGVYPPRLKDISAAKENRPANPETGRPIRVGKEKVIPVQEKSKEPFGKSRNPLEQMPVDSNVPRYDPSQDSQIIEDKNGKRSSIQKKPQEEHPNQAKLPDKRMARQSAISEHVNVLNVLDRVLNTRVEVAVGEIIGVSRELSNQLVNAMKFKSPKAAEAAGFTAFSEGFPPASQGLLIKIRVECDGIPIEAIIDTGSQLNIVKESICKNRIKRPIDCNATMAMNDANGGKGRLNGIVKKVPLDFGSVRTVGNLFVGTHVPFDLLLGRPWQRGNRVSIDELEDGTYLVFKDPITMEPRHKVLVTPDAIRHPGSINDPSTWLAADAPMTCFVNIGNDEGCASPLGSEQSNKVEWRTIRNFPYLAKLHMPPIELGSENNPDLETFTKWLQKPLCRVLFDMPPYLVENSSIMEKKCINKESIQEVKTPPSTPIPLTMEIQLAPATVNHENEIPPLFSTSATARSEAEALLTGLGNHTEYTRNEHLRDLVLSSHDGLVIGHCRDESGFDRTDLMLLKMALVTPTIPNPSGRTTNLDVQYGTGLVHFYPDLGGSAPSGWQIPYLLPSVPKAAVSPSSYTSEILSADFDALQIAPDSAIRTEAEPPSGDPCFHPVKYQSSHNGHDSDDDYEVDVPCLSCLDSHSNSCAATTKLVLPLERLALNCGLEGPPKLDISTVSLPALEHVTDYSSSSDSESDGEEKWRHRWDQLKSDVREELEDEEQVDEWHRELEEARRKNREVQENSRDEQDPVRKPSVLPDGRSCASPSPLLIPDPKDVTNQTILLAGCQPDTERELIARLEEQRKELRGILAANVANNRITPAPPLLTRQRTSHTARQPLVEQPHLNASANDSNKGDRFAHLQPSAGALPSDFVPPPVHVFSLRVDPPRPESRKARSPTPFAFKEDVPQRSGVPITTEEVAVKDSAESAPPDYFSEARVLVNGDTEDSEMEGDSDIDSVPELEDRKSEFASGLPSPTDTEPIKEWLLPRICQLPRAPVTLRPSHYQQACDDFVDESTCLHRSECEYFPCFRPHILALMRDRVLYPFVEVNRPGPVTNESVPIQNRKYYPNPDVDLHYNFLRVKRHIMVDAKTMTHVSSRTPLPLGQGLVFSVLAPRNAPCDLIYPGVIWPNNFGPLDFPPIMSHTWGERYRALRKARASVVNFISRIRKSLTPWQIEEIESPLIMLFTMRDRRLTEKKVSRAMYFRVMHPTFNPLVTRSEAVFLRGACYSFRKFESNTLATAIDTVLRSPQLDTHVCQKMLA